MSKGEYATKQDVEDIVTDAVSVILEAIDGRFNRVESGLSKVEVRLDKVEQRLDGVENRCIDLADGQERIERKLDSTTERVNITAPSLLAM